MLLLAGLDDGTLCPVRLPDYEEPATS